MAVVAPPPFKTNLDRWGSGDSATYPAEYPAPMTGIMSYQYPPTPKGTDMEGSPSGYAPSYPVPASVSAQMDPDSASRDFDRRDSLSKPSKLKRDPSISGQSIAADRASLGILGEKKRNKLGYHRSSVACGHCRRRKIRCIPSPADVQGRCINCIRLKKECSFFPVDQPPPPHPPPQQDTRQKPPARSSVGPKIGSASSSPDMQAGIPSDIHGQQPYALAMSSVQNMAPPLKPAPANFSPDPKMSSSTRPYEYGNPGVNNWMPADASPNSSKQGDMAWRSFPSGSPVTSAFSPYTSHAPPPSAAWTVPVSGDPSSREEMSWPSYPAASGRSLSFGAETMPTQQQQYPLIPQIGTQSRSAYDRKSTDMYPTSIATTMPGIETVPGTSLEQAVSMSAGAVPPTNYGAWQTYPYPKPSDGYGQWYGDTGSQQPIGPGEPGNPAEHGQAGSMYYSGR